MSKTIKLSYIWDKETYLKASKLAYDYELKKSNKKFIGWFFIALTQFGVVAAMKKGSIGLLLISTVLVVYWYFLRWPLRKKVIERTFEKLKNANQKYSVESTENNIAIEGKDIPWSEITQVLAQDDGIFIYLNQDSIFIPNVAFKEFEERNEFLTILKNRISNYTRGV
jgi:hypothetical protein